jgi:hypothetical protein
MVNGVRYSAAVPTREDAQDWIKVVKARAVTGGLPRRITVEQVQLALDDHLRQVPDLDPGLPPGQPRWAHPAGPRLALGGRRHADRHLPAARRAQSISVGRDRGRGLPDLLRAVQRRGLLCDDVMVKSPVKSRQHRPRRQREAQLVLERQELAGCCCISRAGTATPPCCSCISRAGTATPLCCSWPSGHGSGRSTG